MSHATYMFNCVQQMTRATPHTRSTVFTTVGYVNLHEPRHIHVQLCSTNDAGHATYTFNCVQQLTRATPHTRSTVFTTVGYVNLHEPCHIHVQPCSTTDASHTTYTFNCVQQEEMTFPAAGQYSALSTTSCEQTLSAAMHNCGSATLTTGGYSM